MAKGLVTNTYLTNIANAIRAKLGVQTTYQPSQMAAAIESIPTGGSSTLVLSDGIKFGNSSWTSLPNYITTADFSEITDMSRLFTSNSYLTSVPLIDTSNATSMNYMFYYCTRLTSVAFLDTSSVTNMQSMFSHCSALASVPQFNTSAVTDMRYMFDYCSALTTVPVLDTSGLANWGMSGMFRGCTALSNESLNNIMAMCIGATNITSSSYMTLSSVGLSDNQALVCEDLSNWSAFIAAGWTSGY